MHVAINSTRPHTLAFALNDSPAGLAAWLVDKFRSYSDCDGDLERSFTKDELLAEITTYWVTGTIASASRLVLRASAREEPRALLRRASTSRPGAPSSPETSAGSRGRGPSVATTSRRWTEMPSGGHFPGLEEPELLVCELRAFFRPLR